MDMLEVFEKIQREAGVLQLNKQAAGIERIDKGQGDFATRADVESEQLIKKQLGKAYPGIPIIAEEQENLRITAQRFFTVDPIDNTVGYANGEKTGWGSLIGYVEDNAVVCGSVYLPSEELLISAERGHGCYYNGKQLVRRHDKPLVQSIINLEDGLWVDEAVREQVFAPLLESGVSVDRGGSVVSPRILRGEIDAWLFARKAGSPVGGIWDFTAQSLVIAEAGGYACRLDGQPLSWDIVRMNGVLYAASRALAEEIVSLTRAWRVPLE